MAIDVSTAGVIDRAAVKAMPAATGIGGWGAWGWYDRTSQTTYDYAKFHKLDLNAIIVLAQGWIVDHVGLGRIVVGNEEDDGTYTPVPDHPLTKRLQPDGSIGLLRRPNPWESWEETLGATICDLLFGNAYWLLPDANSLADPEVYWLPASFVWVEPETDLPRQRKNGPVRQYWYGETAYPPPRILHFRDRMLDPVQRWMGRNRVAAQIGSAAAVDLLLRFTVASLRNGHAGKVLSPKDSLGGYVAPGSPDEAAMLGLVKRIESGISGENAGRVVPSSVPIEMQDVGRGPEEMALDRIGDLPIALLLGSLGMNMLALDLPGSHAVSTFANKDAAHRGALEAAVIVREDLVASKIASGLLPLFPDPPASDCWWDRRDVEALKENANERVQRAVQLYQANLGSLDECRAIVDLPPVPGGDQTPVERDQAGQQMARQIASGGADGQAPPAAGAIPDGKPDVSAKALKWLSENEDELLVDLTIDWLNNYLDSAIKAAKPKPGKAHWITVWSRRANRYIHIRIEGEPQTRGKRQVTAVRKGSPEQFSSAIARAKAESHLDLQSEHGPPRSKAEAKFAEKTHAQGKVAVIVEKAPTLRTETAGETTRHYVGGRLATEARPAGGDPEDASGGITSGWVNQHYDRSGRKSWTLPHATRAAAEKEALADARGGVKEATETDRVAVRDLEAEDWADHAYRDPHWTTTFRLLTAGPVAASKALEPSTNGSPP